MNNQYSLRTSSKILIILITLLIALVCVYSCSAFKFNKEQTFLASDLSSRKFVNETIAFEFTDEKNGAEYKKVDDNVLKFPFTFDVEGSDLEVTYKDNSKVSYLICDINTIWNNQSHYFLYWVS